VLLSVRLATFWREVCPGYKFNICVISIDSKAVVGTRVAVVTKSVISIKSIMANTSPAIAATA